MDRIVREYTPSIHNQRRIPLSKDERKNRESAHGTLVEPPKIVDPFPTRFTMNRDARALASNALGPYSKVTDIRYASAPLTRKRYRSATWYRSKTKARIQPNAYSMYDVESTMVYSGNPGWDCLNSWAGEAVRGKYPKYDALAMNKARERFVNSCKDKTSSSLGTTLAEWQQSERMIVLRAGQIFSAFRALKSGNITKLGRALGISNVQGFRRKRKFFRRRWKKSWNRFKNEQIPLPDRIRKWSKDLSNLWLEYHFGWAPLLGDIHNACDVLKSNPPAQRVTATGKAMYEFTRGRGAWDWSTVGLYETKAKISAEVYVSNANLALANQLGLVNPVSVAWEVVPFSFLVDWFIPVGKFLASWTDMLGYTVRYAFNTTYCRAKSSQEYKQTGFPSLGGEAVGVGLYRKLGVPAYRFVRPPFNGFSVARGATAISLVIQQFLSIGGSPTYRWSH